MTWTVMAVASALIIGHVLPKVSQWRTFAWFDTWLDFLHQQLATRAFWQRSWAVLLSIGMPALILGCAVAVLPHLWAFIVALLTVLYTWGPRDLDIDVNAIIHADGADAKEQAAQTLFESGQGVRLEGAVIVAAVFENALTRWFAVLFWFLILGPTGALAYRLLHQQAHYKSAVQLPVAQQQMIERLLVLAHCLPAHLMTFAMALAADFDKVIAVWRQWYQHGGWRADYSFLALAANASVASELAEEAADSSDGPAHAPALLELRDAMSLVWRMLLLWLAVLAVFVLAGLVN